MAVVATVPLTYDSAGTNDYLWGSSIVSQAAGMRIRSLIDQGQTDQQIASYIAALTTQPSPQAIMGGEYYKGIVGVAR